MIPDRYRSTRNLTDSPTARDMIDAALHREARKHGVLPAGTRREALALWAHLTIGSDACISPITLLMLECRKHRSPVRALLSMSPHLSQFAAGAVALAVKQAARGIRTIGGAT